MVRNLSFGQINNIPTLWLAKALYAYNIKVKGLRTFIYITKGATLLLDPRLFPIYRWKAAYTFII